MSICCLLVAVFVVLACECWRTNAEEINASSPPSIATDDSGNLILADAVGSRISLVELLQRLQAAEAALAGYAAKAAVQNASLSALEERVSNHTMQLVHLENTVAVILQTSNGSSVGNATEQQQQLWGNVTHLQDSVADLQTTVSSLQLLVEQNLTHRITSQETSFQLTVADLGRNLSLIQTNMSQLMSTANILQSAVADVGRNVTLLQAYNTSTFVSLQSNMSDLQQKTSQLQSNVSSLQASASLQGTNITQLQLLVEQNLMVRISSQETFFQLTVADLGRNLSFTQTNVSQLQSTANSLQSAVADLGRNLSTTQSELTALDGSVAGQQAVIVTVLQNITRIDSQTTLLQDSVNNVSRSLSIVQANVSDIRLMTGVLVQQQNDLQSAVTDLGRNVTLLQAYNTSAFANLQGNVSDLQQKTLQLQSNISSLQSSASQQRTNITQLQTTVSVQAGNITSLSNSISALDSRLVWNVSNGNTYVATGNVGIGVSSPNAKLDVNGALKLADSATACTSTSEGSLKYDLTSKSIQFCNSTVWAPIHVTPPGSWCGLSFLNRGNVKTVVNPTVPVLCLGYDSETSCPPGYARLAMQVLADSGDTLDDIVFSCIKL
eukprot:m.9845 g.9845  ORF g.9845 m.9845 type:complete len:609 (+) comp5082_c1_seq1:215-2041(+)